MSSTARRTAFRSAPLLAAALLIGCDAPAAATAPQERAASQQRAAAVFAGGCFWCTEADFDKMPGVLSTTSGYIGGKVRNPTYEQVSAGGTGHIEAVRVVYDPQKVGYAKLLDIYWRNVDPIDGKGQFCDKGEPYRPAIFVADEEQRRLAEESKAALERSGRFKAPIAVTIEPAAPFWVAEDYHQDYYLKNATKYKFYRWNCGRDARLEALWGAAATH